jgi:hypothetical protein
VCLDVKDDGMTPGNYDMVQRIRYRAKLWGIKHEDKGRDHAGIRTWDPRIGFDHAYRVLS